MLSCPEETQVREAIMTREAEARCATHSNQRGWSNAVFRLIRRRGWSMRQRKEAKDIMTNPPSVAEKMIGDFAPKLAELTDTVLFGDIWERPGLSKRDRSLITVATLVALYRTGELPFHLSRALENGVSKDELIELITHLAFYAGWPTSMTAITLAKDVFAKTE